MFWDALLLLGSRPLPDEELPPDVVPPDAAVVDGVTTTAEVELPLPPAAAWVVVGEAKVGEAAGDEVGEANVGEGDEAPPELPPPELPPPELPPPVLPPPPEQVSLPTVQVDPEGQQPPNSSLQQKEPDSQHPLSLVQQVLPLGQLATESQQ